VRILLPGLEKDAMGSPPVNRESVRRRVLGVVQKVLGYQPEADVRELNDIDSLQILELLVSLEEEFDIDSDRILESRTDWWVSVDDLVTIIADLAEAETTTPR
jgi:acyl carrier protein